jgi:hypothetical protein
LIRVTAVNGNAEKTKKNKISQETDLYKYNAPFNTGFWGNYNAPPETEEEKRTIGSARS